MSSIDKAEPPVTAPVVLVNKTKVSVVAPSVARLFHDRSCTGIRLVLTNTQLAAYNLIRQLMAIHVR